MFVAAADQLEEQVRGVLLERGRAVKPVLLPRKLTNQDPEVWLSHFFTTKCDCTFYPYFTATSGALTGTFDVTNHGEPWRVSSAGSLPTLYPDTEHRVWAVDTRVASAPPDLNRDGVSRLIR